MIMDKIAKIKNKHPKTRRIFMNTNTYIKLTKEIESIAKQCGIIYQDNPMKVLGLTIEITNTVPNNIIHGGE